MIKKLINIYIMSKEAFFAGLINKMVRLLPRFRQKVMLILNLTICKLHLDIGLHSYFIFAGFEEKKDKSEFWSNHKIFFCILCVFPDFLDKKMFTRIRIQKSVLHIRICAQTPVFKIRIRIWTLFFFKSLYLPLF